MTQHQLDVTQRDELEHITKVLKYREWPEIEKKKDQIKKRCLRKSIKFRKRIKRLLKPAVILRARAYYILGENYSYHLWFLCRRKVGESKKFVPTLYQVCLVSKICSEEKGASISNNFPGHSKWGKGDLTPMSDKEKFPSYNIKHKRWEKNASIRGSYVDPIPNFPN